jgi:hypothetical protein
MAQSSKRVFRSIVRLVGLESIALVYMPIPVAGTWDLIAPVDQVDGKAETATAHASVASLARTPSASRTNSRTSSSAARSHAGLAACPAHSARSRVSPRAAAARVAASYRG